MRVEHLSKMANYMNMAANRLASVKRYQPEAEFEIYRLKLAVDDIAANMSDFDRQSYNEFANQRLTTEQVAAEARGIIAEIYRKNPIKKKMLADVWA